MIKLLLPDFDGFLVDSVPLHYKAEMDFLRECGIEKPKRLVRENKSRLKPFFGMPARVTLPEIVRLARMVLPGASISLPRDFLAQLEERKIALFREKLQPMEGAEDFLKFGCLDYCIISSNSTRLVKLSLDFTGLAANFRGSIISADDVKRGKPMPDLHKLAAQRYGVALSECMAFDDAVNGIIAAKNAGAGEIVGFCGGSHYPECSEATERELRKAGAGHVFRHMVEVNEFLEARRRELLRRIMPGCAYCSPGPDG